MRVVIGTALSAVLAVFVMADLKVRVYGQSNSTARDFTGARLTALPATSWPTNGGNLYNQRYSPLKAINRENVTQLKGVWRARLAGSGTAPQYSGFAAPIVYEGIAYISTGAN